MSLSENDIELIEKHLEGILTKEEEEAFEQKEAISSSFAEEVSLQKAMIAAIKLDERKALREELKTEVKKIVLPSPSNKYRLKYYSIAATISLLIAAAYIFVPSNDSLFDAYYSPFPESPITRSESGNTSDYDVAMQQYSIGNYQKATDIFLQVNDSTIQHEIALYLSNCYLNINAPEKAILLLQTIITSENSQINTHAQWFLALAYLRDHNKQEASELLHTISQKGTPYKEQAISLLNKLRWSFY